MTIQSQAWESTLLSFAQEALHHGTHHSHSNEYPCFHESLLDEAYGYCNNITATHSRSFHLASSLLPPEKRRAVRALYAFCRISDDIVDASIAKEFVDNAFVEDMAEAISPQSTSSEAEIEPDIQLNDIGGELEAWRGRMLTHLPSSNDFVAVAWFDARSRYHIPKKYAVQLIDGVARDLHQSRYSDFSELASYCYGVASTVGLMSMHIIGYAGDEAIPYAIKLGVALQITNILRDVAEDFQAGRVYLPQDELQEFGLSDSHLNEGISTGKVTNSWRSFMRFQIERNRQLYKEAMPGIKLLNSDGRFAIAAAAGLYQGILDDIERNDYNIFARRAHVSGLRKLSMLPKIWFSSR